MARGESSDDAGPLVFHGRLTESDVVALWRSQGRILLRRPFRLSAQAIAIIVFALSIWYIADKGPDLIGIPMLTGSAYVLFLLPYERGWAARRHYRRHPGDYLESEVRLTGDRVTVGNDAFRAEYAWRLIGGLADSPAGILFYTQARQAVLFLPARLLERDKLRERVIALALGNGVRVSRA
jgi:hypothetical protein